MSQFKVYEILSDDDKNQITDHWNRFVVPNFHKYCNIFYARLKQHFPAHLLFFGDEHDEHEQNQKYYTHCQQFMKIIDLIVKDIKNPNVILKQIEFVGQSHPRIADSEFSKMRVTLLDMLEELYDARSFRKDLADSWEKFLRILFYAISERTSDPNAHPDQ